MTFYYRNINKTIVLPSDIEKGVEKYFTVVYGYNEDLLIDSYGIKLNTSNDMVTSNIGHREYFIDAFPGEFAGSVECTGKDGSDMTKAFND